jgi:hypothetical protein
MPKFDIVGTVDLNTVPERLHPLAEDYNQLVEDLWCLKAKSTKSFFHSNPARQAVIAELAELKKVLEA